MYNMNSDNSCENSIQCPVILSLGQQEVIRYRILYSNNNNENMVMTSSNDNYEQLKEIEEMRKSERNPTINSSLYC